MPLKASKKTVKWELSSRVQNRIHFALKYRINKYTAVYWNGVNKRYSRIWQLSMLKCYPEKVNKNESLYKRTIIQNFSNTFWCSLQTVSCWFCLFCFCSVDLLEQGITLMYLFSVLEASDSPNLKPQLETLFLKLYVMKS